MAYNDLDWQYNISETLSEFMCLNRRQARLYSAWENDEPDYNNPIFTEGYKNVEFWNSPGQYSHLCYWKGGHSIINNIFEMCNTDPNLVSTNHLGFWKSKLPEEDIIVVPYKDPLDKFISAYFTSFGFKEQTHYGTSELWSATLNPKPGQVNELVDECYSRLDKFMKRVAELNSPTGFGREEKYLFAFNNTHQHLIKFTEMQSNNPEAHYDVHFTPIHVLLLLLLKDYDRRFKLLGMNLDNNPNQFIFRDIRTHRDIPQELKNQLHDRQTANNNIIKIASNRWKQMNHLTSKIIIEKFLWNDYRLIDQLARNTSIANAID